MLSQTLFLHVRHLDKNIKYLNDSSHLIKDVKNILKNVYQVDNLLENNVDAL